MRYLRLYAHFLRFSLSRAFEFRVDFYFRVAMDCIYYAVNIAFFTILYRRTGLIGGWTEQQAYVFVCGYLVADAFQMTLFANNMWMLPDLINKGDLDYYLVRPVSSLFFLSFREFAINSALNVVIACGLMAWSIANLPETLGAGRIAIYLLFIVNGIFVTYIFRMLAITPVFWLHSSRGLDELHFSLEQLAERPHQIFAGWFRRLILTVLPYAFIASVPSHILFEGLTLELALHVTVVTALLFLAMVAFWRAGLRAYASASS